ncbi:MAG TPA: hypothetical protein VJS11_07245 [Acidobacteriaceae bacterium]|nr:hypothetical protein [Acidobacteriaceae bacterium]
MELAAALGFTDSGEAQSVISEAAQIAAMIQSLLAGMRPNIESGRNRE